MNTIAKTEAIDTHNQPKTAREVIAENVQLLIEQLGAGHSEALTDYLNAMSRFSPCTRFRLLPAPARRLRGRTPRFESAPAHRTAVQS